MEKPDRFTPQPRSVSTRAMVHGLAPSQPAQAFDLARTIPDGWYRCQAMSHIAGLAPEPLSKLAFDEARTAAAAAFDPYQQAAVLAWPIKAAVDREDITLARNILGDALALIPSVEPIASRAHAAHLLWSMCLEAGDALREPIWRTIIAHVHPDRSWRAALLYREIARMRFEATGGEGVARVLAVMPDGKARRKIERDLARNYR